ncbi:4-hydroxy-3-methylbut-2-enyl diphosphate reductase [Phenylobacterium sp. LjRoot225]|uniref:4-hydroxy-3-methylbut-2-enyl diphosphate reductase n=1 Tax=Phenylobacterium sp. LjRoot225 TaxID=3342285 RepID=UPI003ECDE454
MKLFLANPRGFCAGVERAIAIVEQMLSTAEEPVFVRHEIVHNRVVVEHLRARGAVFVEDVSEIPLGALAVVSAHGAPISVFREAGDRSLRLIDATCPLVSKVHLEVARHARQGRSVIVIGHRDHVEVKGIIGHYEHTGAAAVMVVESNAEAEAVAPPTPDNLGYVTQTTLSVSHARGIIAVLRRRFPHIIAPHAQDICYATENRQNAVRKLAEACDLILVIGAPHSSNSQRLKETAQGEGVAAQLIERPEEIQAEWLTGLRTLGLTSSASAPEHLVASTIERLTALSPGLVIEEFGKPEMISFRLPAGLSDFDRAEPDSARA